MVGDRDGFNPEFIRAFSSLVPAKPSPAPTDIPITDARATAIAILVATVAAAIPAASPANPPTAAALPAAVRPAMADVALATDPAAFEAALTAMFCKT